MLATVPVRHALQAAVELVYGRRPNRAAAAAAAVRWVHLSTRERGRDLLTGDHRPMLIGANAVGSQTHR